MAITISGQNNNDKILASDGVLDSISGFNVVGVMTASTFDVNGKLTANHLNIGSNINFGNAGIITATTLIGNVTGNVNHNSNLLLQISGSEKLRIANSGAFGLNGTNYGSSGQVLTSQGSGSSPVWTTISSDKITEGNTEAEVVDTGSNGYFYVNTEGTERFRVTSNGTVNIGDADHVDDEYLSSTLKIQKDQNSVTRFTMRNEHSGAGSAAAVQIGASGNSWMLQCGSNANDSNAFTIRVDGTANGNTGTERFRIKTDGKVGVNTTGPSQQFTSYADSGYPILANSSSNGIGLGGNGAIVFGTKDLGSYAPGILDASTLEFKISGTPRLNIDSSGRVGINRTPALASSKLEVGGADNYPLINVEASGATGGMGIGGGALKFYYGTTERFSVANTRIDAKEPLYLETAGSYIKSNQLLFNPSGAAYIDHGVAGQSLNFRMSSSSALDTNAMTINHNGHITKPNQPMCSYDLNSSIQSGNYIIHNTVHTNNGSHYNTGNGRFVCPVAGYYYASIMAMTNNSNTQLDIELHKNGSNPNNILVPYNQNGGVYNQVAGSCIIYCAANDYLQFKLNSGSIYNGRHSNITFALLA